MSLYWTVNTWRPSKTRQPKPDKTQSQTRMADYIIYRSKCTQAKLTSPAGVSPLQRMIRKAHLVHNYEALMLH